MLYYYDRINLYFLHREARRQGASGIGTPLHMRHCREHEVYDLIYPEYIKKGDVIGFCAPSDGDADEIGQAKLDSAAMQMRSRGYDVKETSLVRCSEKGRSGDGKTRGEDFMSLIADPAVKAVFSVSGGDWLFEMLPYVDFDLVRKNPKWFEGMSDPTGLVHTITTIADVASVYCANAGEFGMQPWDESLVCNFRILEGENIIQESKDIYESQWRDYGTGYETYAFDAPVCIRRIDGAEDVSISGRLLGGCMDVLVGLCGTRFDRTAEFAKKYGEDGILWYLEVFSMTPELIAFYLWKFKEAGWFENASGFLFGRPCMLHTEYSAVTYEEAIMSVLGDLGRPVVTGIDVGHRAPHWTMINGAVGKFTFTSLKEDGNSSEGRACLKQILR